MRSYRDNRYRNGFRTLKFVKCVIGILLALAILYCCDLPCLPGFEFLNHNNSPFFYNIGLSFLASCVFYLVQSLIPQTINKYLIESDISSILDSIRRTQRENFYVMTHKYYIDNMTEDEIAEIIKSKDLRNDCSYQAKNNEYMSIIEAYAYNHQKIVESINTLMNMKGVDRRIICTCYKYLLDPSHEEIIRIKENDRGEVTGTDENGNAIIGITSYSYGYEKIIATGLKAFDELLKEMESTFCNVYHISDVDSEKQLLRIVIPHSLTGTKIKHAVKDFKTSVEYDNLRISDQAVYFNDNLYIPLSDIVKLKRTATTLKIQYNGSDYCKVSVIGEKGDGAVEALEMKCHIKCDDD